MKILNNIQIYVNKLMKRLRKNIYSNKIMDNYWRKPQVKMKINLLFNHKYNKK